MVTSGNTHFGYTLVLNGNDKCSLCKIERRLIHINRPFSMMSGTEKTCIFFTFFGLNVQIQEKFITWDNFDHFLNHLMSPSTFAKF